MTRLRSESGFTLIETLVSAFLLVLGLLGLVASMDRSRDLAAVSENEVTVMQVAERQLESALALPFDRFALTSVPSASGPATADGPSWHAIGPTAVPRPSGGRDCAANPSTNPTGPNDEWACLVSCPAATPASGCPAGGLLAPVSTLTDDRGNRFRVFRYVTWVNDVACGSGCPSPATLGWQGDYKRAVIAVQLLDLATGSGVTSSLKGPTRPVVVSGVKAEPMRTTGNQQGDPSPCVLAGVRCG